MRAFFCSEEESEMKTVKAIAYWGFLWIVVANLVGLILTLLISPRFAIQNGGVSALLAIVILLVWHQRSKNKETKKEIEPRKP